MRCASPSASSTSRTWARSISRARTRCARSRPWSPTTRKSSPTAARCTRSPAASTAGSWTTASCTASPRTTIGSSSTPRTSTRTASTSSEHAGSICTITDHSDAYALLAVQGPKARGIVDELAGGTLSDVGSFGLAKATVAGADVVAARTGYTGEDGFELFVDNDAAKAVWDAVVAAGAEPIGLGARDTLRLEARLCLYGNDIDETTNAYEAGLGWVVKLDRGPDAPRFVGPGRPREGQSRRGHAQARRLRDRRTAASHARAPRCSTARRSSARSPAADRPPTVGGAIGMAYVPKALAGPGQTADPAAAQEGARRRAEEGPVLQAARVITLDSTLDSTLESIRSKTTMKRRHPRRPSLHQGARVGSCRRRHHRGRHHGARRRAARRHHHGLAARRGQHP